MGEELHSPFFFSISHNSAFYINYSRKRESDVWIRKSNRYLFLYTCSKVKILILNPNFLNLFNSDAGQAHSQMGCPMNPFVVTHQVYLGPTAQDLNEKAEGAGTLFGVS